MVHSQSCCVTMSHNLGENQPYEGNRNEPLRVAIVGFSLSKQTSEVLAWFARGVTEGAGADKLRILDVIDLECTPKFQFPWTMWDFFEVMPETVWPMVIRWWKHRRISPPPLSLQGQKPDLVILGWQTWFLSPSLPVRLMTMSPEWQRVLEGVPVLLVGTHRNMWHRASSCLRADLLSAGARHVGRVNFVQKSAFLKSVVSTVRWQFGGTKGDAGIDEKTPALSYKYGLEYGRILFQRGTPPEWFEAGAARRLSLTVLEYAGFPCKAFFALVMGMAPPKSNFRRIITLVYVPLLLAYIIAVCSPLLLIGAAANQLIVNLEVMGGYVLSRL